MAKVVTTANMYLEEEFAADQIIDVSKLKKGLKEYQTVVAVGPHARDIKVGDLVCINPKRYAQLKYKKDELKEAMDEHYNQVVRYNFPMINIDGKDHLMIEDIDVEFIVNEFED